MLNILILIPVCLWEKNRPAAWYIELIQGKMRAANTISPTSKFLIRLINNGDIIQGTYRRFCSTLFWNEAVQARFSY